MEEELHTSVDRYARVGHKTGPCTATIDDLLCIHTSVTSALDGGDATCSHFDSFTTE
jgi:hypothetical protein